MIQNLARAAVTTLLAVGAVAALSGTAHASTGSLAATKSNTVASPTTVLSAGQQQLYSTWLWGSTRLCATNWDGRRGTLKVQSSSPAARPEYMYIAGNGSTKCIDRWWWGVPVWAVNSGITDLYVSTS